MRSVEKVFRAAIETSTARWDSSSSVLATCSASASAAVSASWSATCQAAVISALKAAR